jgi:hypothetical protein
MTPAFTPRRGLRLGTGIFVVLLLATAVALGIAAYSGLSHLEGSWPLRIVVDGEPVLDGIHVGPLPPAHQVVLAAVIVLGVLAALVVLPVALIFLAVAFLALLLVVLGVPLLVVLAVVFLILSPVLLLVWGLVKLIS